MTLLQSIILGIVEGITEFLPVSSTGHLILADALLRIQATDFTKSFNIIIQLGAIFAVTAMFWATLWKWETIKKLFVAFIPTGILGLLLYKTIKAYLLGNQAVVLWALLLGGIAIILLEIFHKEKSDAPLSISDISYKQAFVIGLFQAIAIIPGVSRSAATIGGGLLLGISRVAIVEFSFLLAVPTMLAATGLDVVKNYKIFSTNQIGILTIGFITAFIIAMLTVRFLLGYIQKHGFKPFGIYRIILALVFWLIIL